MTSESGQTPNPMAVTELRTAVPSDVEAICQFGAAVVEPPYTPLIGRDAAAGQVRLWWNTEHIASAVCVGDVVAAFARDGSIVGVGQHGRYGDDYVIYKLYVHPDHRGAGLGRHLIELLVGGLPREVGEVWIEHFAANARAGAFYEREGFTVRRVEDGPQGQPELQVIWRSRAVG